MRWSIGRERPATIPFTIVNRMVKPVQKLAGSGDPAYKGSISRQFL
jgi:hypothetical protein